MMQAARLQPLHLPLTPVPAFQSSPLAARTAQSSSLEAQLAAADGERRALKERCAQLEAQVRTTASRLAALCLALAPSAVQATSCRRLLHARMRSAELVAVLV